VCFASPGAAQEPKLPPAPAPDVSPLISRIAFGSCSSQDRPMPLLRTLVEWKPDLFIYLGDNIYGDTRDMTVLQAKYGELAANRDFQALRAQVPLIATWDDHDYGEDDAGSEYPFKTESKEIFLKFWNEPNPSPRREHPGIYTSYVFADESIGKRLQVILLDTRTFRDPLTRNELSSWRNDYRPDSDRSKTFLGDAQWKWLGERLREPADLRIIGTSIQFAHQHNGWESWTNFPHEVHRMVDLIKDCNANGVVFISGDVHWGELSVLRPPSGYPLYDVTASGINQEWDELEPNQNRIGEACMDHHFGMIEIDWTRADPAMSLRIHDYSGRARVRKTVRQSELKLP
jgi:alkaline phosphatase D